MTPMVFSIHHLDLTESHNGGGLCMRRPVTPLEQREVGRNHICMNPLVQKAQLRIGSKLAYWQDIRCPKARIISEVIIYLVE